MARRSLSFKLIFGGIIVVLIPLAVVGFIGVYNTSNTLEEIGKNRAEIVASNLAQGVDNILAEETKIVAVMATSPVVVGLCGEAVQSGKATDASVAKTNAWLGRLAKKIGKYYEAIIVADTKGQVIADSVDGRSSKINVGDRSYFKAAQDGKTAISRPLTSKLSGTPVVAISAPVVDAGGKFQGMVAVIMATEAFSKQVVSTRIGKTGYPFIVDSSGVVVAHPDPKHILKTNLTKVAGMQEFMRVMLQGKTGTAEYDFEGDHKVAGFAQIAITKWSLGFTQSSDEFMDAAYRIRDLTILVAVIALVLTVVGVFFFSRTISKPITHAVLRLNEGSDHVATASNEVAQAGQSLAEGTSEQAASIEETSASLEELTSMTKQNTDNASQADSLMTQVSTMAASASEAMSEMRQSMDEISTSGQEISKIIKSIDEIAFQTNLLALNAAVEAARAGEAGAGFAVVADEVRNLAMRAAEAAKNTADLIEDTIEKIDHGNQLVGRVDESFTEVTTNAGKVAELVSEIAAASNEQTQGITQINTAVGEMEKVTQTTAASAEESAASAEELSAQAEEIRGIATQLMSVIGGKVEDARQAVSAPDKPKRGLKKLAALPRPGGKEKAMPPRQKETKSEDIIPLDDDDFADF